MQICAIRGGGGEGSFGELGPASRSCPDAPATKASTILSCAPQIISEGTAEPAILNVLFQASHKVDLFGNAQADDSLVAWPQEKGH